MSITEAENLVNDSESHYYPINDLTPLTENCQVSRSLI